VLRDWVNATELARPEAETLEAEADTTDCEPALAAETEAELVTYTPPVLPLLTVALVKAGSLEEPCTEAMLLAEIPLDKL